MSDLAGDVLCVCFCFCVCVRKRSSSEELIMVTSSDISVASIDCIGDEGGDEGGEGRSLCDDATDETGEVLRSLCWWLGVGRDTEVSVLNCMAFISWGQLIIGGGVVCVLAVATCLLVGVVVWLEVGVVVVRCGVFGIAPVVWSRVGGLVPEVVGCGCVGWLVVGGMYGGVKGSVVWFTGNVGGLYWGL